MILVGDCRELMAGMEPESVDAIVTDPPAGIAFMGKKWDADKGGRDAWIEWLGGVLAEGFRLLKPGGHALVWALPRTSHWTGMALEAGGFEVRDCITHLFGSGFPKSHNLGNGWGTALKPGAEFWWLARKPLIGTVAANVERYGTGALNIDGCRVEGPKGNGVWGSNQDGQKSSAFIAQYGRRTQQHSSGRWPANVVLDEEAGRLLDQQAGERPKLGVYTKSLEKPAVAGGFFSGITGKKGTVTLRENLNKFSNQTGGASRFFYCAKASRKERERGLEGMRAAVPPKLGMANDPEYESSDGGRRSGFRHATANHHPTVKPVALMRWLVRLVTPPNGLVLDPFAGSGTTGIACVLEGFEFVGIEQDAEYADIAEKRIAAVEPDLFAEAK